MLRDFKIVPESTRWTLFDTYMIDRGNEHKYSRIDGIELAKLLTQEEQDMLRRKELQYIRVDEQALKKLSQFFFPV